MRDSFLSLAAVGAAGMTRIIFSIGAARVFTPVTVGHANTLIAIATFITLLVSPGMGQAVAKEVALRAADEDPTERTRIFNWGTWVHHILLVVLTLITWLVLPAMFHLTWRGLGQISLLVIGYGGYTYYKAVFYGANRVRGYIRNEVVSDIAFLGLLAMVLILHDLRWVTVPMIGMYLLFTLLSIAKMPMTFDVRVPRPVMKQVLMFAVITSVGAAASTGSMYLAQVFATQASHRGEGAGLFAVAIALVSPAYLIPRALSTVLFPAMTEAVGRGDHTAVSWQFWKATSLLAGAMLPGFALVGVASKFFMVTIFGQPYTNAATLASILVWSTWVYVAAVPSVNVLIAQHHHGNYIIPTAAAVLSTIFQVGYWVLAATSVTDVAIGYLMGAIIQCAIPMILVVRQLRRPGWSAWLRWGAAIVAAVVITRFAASLSTGLNLVAGLVAMLIATALVFPELKLMWQTFLTNRGEVEASESLV